MTKKMKYLIGLVIVILIAGGIGFTAFHKSTAQDLQSHRWTFVSSKDNGTATTAKFSKENLTLSQAGFNEVYSYKLTKHNNDEQIKFVGKNSVSGNTEIRRFEIKKQSDKYKLTPVNTLAKTDTGTVSLIPK